MSFKVLFKKRSGILEISKAENSLKWKDENEEKVSVLIPLPQIEKQLVILSISARMLPWNLETHYSN